MIQPHGNKLVERLTDSNESTEHRDPRPDAPSIALNRNLFIDFLNIAQGVYSPLEGFMSRNDFLKVINDMTLESGVTWPLPIVLDIDADLASEINPEDRVRIHGPDDTPVGILNVEDVYRYNQERVCERLFETTEENHPGVRAVENKSPFLVGGSIKAFAEAIPPSKSHDLTPRETRVLFRQLGWDTIVGFQTRNVPHRAHEYLQKSALEHVDGLLIQPKIGEKKPKDYTDNAILKGYESLIENYYPNDLVVLTMFKSRMMYAGPREAVFDSIIRKNFGCTHFIVGRDHAGVGNYYDDFEAQRLFEAIGGVGIQPFYYHYAFYCNVCDGIVSEKICPHDNSHRVEPSGTEMRETLSKGQQPSPKMMRPEVAKTVLGLNNIFVR